MNSEDPRIKEIQEQILAFARADFQKRVTVSGNGDGIDAIIAGLNTLGEELDNTNTIIENKKRINHVMEVLLKYTIMDFSERIKVSDKGDELDAIAVGLNTLGEELEDYIRKLADINKELENTNNELTQKNIYFNQSLEMLGTASLEGYFLVMNDSFERELGYTKEELKAAPFINYVHPDDVDKTLKEVEKLAAGETTLNFVNRYRCKNGEYIWLQWSTIVFEGLLYAAARNITLQKTQEEELAAQTFKLEQLNSELESFSYSVSHDLRAPLRSINGFTQILQDTYESQFDDEAKRFMKIIMSNARKMGQLIDDLLEFSRLAKQNLVKAKLNMNDLVAQVTTELIGEQTGKQIALNLKPLADAYGDAGMIKQVLINLISNAIKYSAKKEKIEIETGSYVEDKNVVYYIKDNGAGFDMNYYDKLFGVFQRLHKANEYEGTGIGLSMVQRIIIKHDGRVWAEGKVNEGATFYFSLPIPANI